MQGLCWADAYTLEPVEGGVPFPLRKLLQRGAVSRAEVMEAVFAGYVRSQSEASGGKVFQTKVPL